MLSASSSGPLKVVFFPILESAAVQLRCASYSEFSMFYGMNDSLFCPSAFGVGGEIYQQITGGIDFWNTS